MNSNQLKYPSHLHYRRDRRFKLCDGGMEALLAMAAVCLVDLLYGCVGCAESGAGYLTQPQQGGNLSIGAFSQPRLPFQFTLRALSFTCFRMRLKGQAWCYPTTSAGYCDIVVQYWKASTIAVRTSNPLARLGGIFDGSTE